VRLTHLRIFQFRNFLQQEILLFPGTNLFSGLNGQGKTNLLEAIYLLGYGRSFRTARPKECIQHGKTECAVEGAFEDGGATRSLRVQVSSGDKKLFVYGKPAPIDEFVGLFHVVAFTNAHLSVVRGSPGERRTFLDRAMLTLFPGHLRLLANYGRALKQRNRILSEAKEDPGQMDLALLESWDEALIREGARIVLNRLRYVRALKAAVQPGLFGAEELKMHYLSTIPDASPDAESTEQAFRRQLSSRRSADLRSGVTSVGPHRDDLKLYADGKSLADYGSAGQQRSCLLSLYFAQMEIHRKERGFYPVFLVDDVEAELDSRRLRTFLGYLAERTQTFLTTAKESFLPSLPAPVHRYEVTAGAIHSPE
jgi:DNA replication and repair protein RecF